MVVHGRRFLLEDRVCPKVAQEVSISLLHHLWGSGLRDSNSLAQVI